METVHDNLLALLEQIDRDFGAVTRRPPIGDLSGVPAPLRALYAISDGLELPFGIIYKQRDVSSDGFEPGWACFGQDGHSSYFLCRTVEGITAPSLTTWDHDFGGEPAPEYASAHDWLEAEYRSFVERSDHVADVDVRSVPGPLDLTALAKEAARLGNVSLAALLYDLRRPPTILRSIESPKALAMARLFRQAGVDCILTRMRPADTTDEGDGEEAEG